MPALDDDIKYTRFRKPATLTVDKKAWIELCDELHKKSTIGTFVIIAIGAIVSFFSFMLVLIICIGVGLFISVSVRRKFNQLRSLADHSFVISSSEVSDTFEGEKQIIPFNKIKNIEIHNWGLEIDTKKDRKMSDKDPNKGRIQIPCKVNDYGRVLATFENID